MRPTRRGLLGAMSAGLGGAVAARLLGAGVLAGMPPRRARAAAADRKFLFLFCNGGWDTSRVFTPMDRVPNAELEEARSLIDVGGFRIVDHPSRPLTRAFFENHAGRTCVINGIEVRSVAHERSRRMLLASESGDDWPTLIAAASAETLTLPHLVLAGPSYVGRHADRVVRVGNDGQLVKLLDGEAQAASARPIAPLPEGVEALADQFVATRADSLAAGSHAGERTLGLAYRNALGSVAALQEIEGLSLEAQEGVCSRDVSSDAVSALNCFQLGLSRTAMLQYSGFCDESWDNHTNLDKQSLHFEELFVYLDGLLLELDSRGMQDEVTVVVLSEMGRHPMLNNWGGKDHWTYTSAMLLGAGVAGGRMIGELDESAMGRRVDPDLGLVDDAGEALLPEHLGATLLALAGVDPLSLGVTAPPIGAALSG